MTALDFTKPAPSRAPSLLSRIMRTVRLATYSACGAVALIVAISAVQSDMSQTAQYPTSGTGAGGEVQVSRLSTMLDSAGGLFGYGKGTD